MPVRKTKRGVLPVPGDIAIAIHRMGGLIHTVFDMLMALWAMKKLTSNKLTGIASGGISGALRTC